MNMDAGPIKVVEKEAPDRKIPEGLSRVEREILRDVLTDNPSISSAEALAMLRSAGM
jgi:hypothetical protein